MRSLRRWRGRGSGDPIEAFWQWWANDGGTALAESIARQDPHAISAVLADHVHRIDKALDWELGPGLHAQHALVVTAAGDPAVRAVARRWLRAAPPSDWLWEYADLRRPAPTFTLRFTGLPAVEIDAAWVTAVPDDSAAAVHVGVHHPVFLDLPEDARRRITFLLLDLTLGEEMVETWVGAVEVLPDRPADAVPIRDLLPAVAAFAAQFTTEDGDPTWRLLEGEQDGQRLIASTEVPLRSIRLPHLDTHVGIAVGYRSVRDDGLPETDMLDHLRALEDHLTNRLGDSGRLLAHETFGGTRTLHFYVDGTTPAASQLRAALGGWSHGPIEVRSSSDPAWRNVRHLAG
ncbi:uncharacterized protein DUF695 [Kribbella amoyensis]|uniref:Uncharacterized protein DUF695 n=1 Tax=Kribbella amoyensis TaxID=996641 RepID=A0A561BLM0_9ACTN|nr:DUF695 domain-containing protein [Kribbella amoyensis]TWD79796.1 uncharacterized protein DUF695 [Kribbella amoyensis]